MREEKQILNGEPEKCVWMTAGVVGFKLCNLQFDCEHCPFDRAIRGASTQDEAMESRQLINEQGFRLDTSSFYADTHVWLRIEDEGRVRVGLDDFGQRLTGRVYSLQLPEPGQIVNTREGCWKITHAYGESQLGSGLEGIIFQKNEKLQQMPSLLNTDPYGEGWAFVLEPSHLLEGLKALYYGRRVRQWVGEETQRLRSLLDVSAGSIVTLQDGGIPVENLSAGINSEIINLFLSPGREIRNMKRR